MPKVHPIAGEPMRFHVQSKSRRDVRHLVDLAEDNGDGQCGCEQFQMRIAPKRKQGVINYCDHIVSAYRYFGKQMVKEILKGRK